MEKIKDLVKGLVVALLRILRQCGDRVSNNFLYDELVFRKWARPNLNGTSSDAISVKGEGYSRESLRALVTMEYHRIEKGLALPDPRLGFGQDVVARLVELLGIYTGNDKYDTVSDSALGALESYLRFHEDRLDVIDSRLLLKIEETVASLEKESSIGGTITRLRSEVLAATKFDYSAFCSTRHSVRDFEGGLVEEKHVMEAISDATTTPSVCNRQASRLVYLKDPEMIQKVLELQNGNRGFGHQVGGLLVVYYDISNFVSVGERNQGWIDSGMFSMNLVFALHSRRVGSCCLNWSVDYLHDSKLNSLLGLEGSSRVVMLIAIGKLKESFLVAASNKLTPAEITKVV